MIKKLNILAKIILLGIVLLISNYKTLGFYFWHDDFSSFYGPQVHQCIHGWPYYNFCTIFVWLFKIFGYKPFPYFLLGNILEFSSIIIFYFLLIKILKKPVVSLLLSGLLASSYVAAGIFLEAWDPLISYSVLATLFLSLILYFDAIKNGLNKKLFILSTIIFLISISLFNFRSVTNFAPVILLIIIFANKIKIGKRIFLCILIIILFALVFYLIPVKLLHLPIDSFENYPDSFFKINKITYFLQTISSFIFTDFIQTVLATFLRIKEIDSIKTITGFIATSGFIIYSFVDKKDKHLTKLRVFAVIWTITMFAPYWIRNDFSLNTTHRYILWMYPGILIAWGSLYKFKLWIPVTLIFILINIFAVNSFYGDFLGKSKERENFFYQLHTLLPKVYEGSILYFDFQPNVQQSGDDFFRVGFTPPESALGAEYAVDYKKIKLITQSQDLEKLLSELNFPIKSFYSFFYNGKLTNTTLDSRSLIASLKSNNQHQFNFKNYKPVIPIKLKIQIISSQTPVTFPLKVTCDKCKPLDISDKELQKIFNFLKSQSTIDHLTTSDIGEKSDIKYINDNSVDTYWIGNRQLWYRGEKPFIDITVPKKTDIDGLIIYSSSKSHIPTEFTIEENGNKVDSSVAKWLNGQKIIFSKRINVGNHLKITINKTDGGDVPIISELKLLPAAGFKDIDLEKSDNVRESQASFVITKTNYKAFTDFLSSGVTACLSYKSQSYGNGQTEFKLFIDNKVHNYEINIPSLGIESPVLSVSCLPYEVKTIINKTTLSL